MGEGGEDGVYLWGGQIGDGGGGFGLDGRAGLLELEDGHVVVSEGGKGVEVWPLEDCFGGGGVRGL